MTALYIDQYTNDAEMVLPYQNIGDNVVLAYERAGPANGTMASVRKLVDEADQPVAGERYEVTMPDGSVAKGSLDGEGFARIDGIDPPGECQITWPDLDKDAWKKA